MTALDSLTADAFAEADPAPADFALRLAAVLGHQIKACTSEQLKGRPAHRFESVAAPPISVRDYVVRLKTYFACSNEALVISLIYLDRVVKLHPNFSISPLSIHRLALTTLLTAVKFHDDIWYSNAHYAKAGGITLRELNQLEAMLLRLLRWQLYVSPEEYENYLDCVLWSTAVQKATAEAPAEAKAEDDALEAETAPPSSAASDSLSEASEEIAPIMEVC